MESGDSRRLYNELCFPLILGETKLHSWPSPPFPVPLGGGEESPVASSSASEPHGVHYHASRKNSWRWGGWGAGAGGGKAQQLLRMNETISHGSAKLHEVPVYPC